MTKFVRMTIAERFPVIPMTDHTATNQGLGPFYVPNSEWFKPFSSKTLKAEQYAAQYWRDRGYTVSVDVVQR